VTKPILAATYFKTNAEIIQACVTLGFLNRDMKVLDPTYGNGLWWTLWKPRRLVKHDLTLDGVDFRNQPHRDNSFDAAAYDPPYVSVGGRETSRIKAMYEAYGLLGAPVSPRLLQILINDGLKEMWRLVKPQGYVLVKCQDYVSSGKLHSGTFHTEFVARDLGFEIVEKFIHVKKSGGPQPGNRTRKSESGERVASKQQHARHNASVLIVCRVPKNKELWEKRVA
jgi:hypothetical protein